MNLEEGNEVIIECFNDTFVKIYNLDLSDKDHAVNLAFDLLNPSTLSDRLYAPRDIWGHLNFDGPSHLWQSNQKEGFGVGASLISPIMEAA